MKKNHFIIAVKLYLNMIYISIAVNMYQYLIYNTSHGGSVVLTPVLR